MAVNRVLTNAEKELLQVDARFKSECQWAVRNFASYYATQDLGQVSTQIAAVGYEQWFKSRVYANNILANGVNDSDIGLEFCILAKGMLLWDSAISQFNVNTVVDYMITNSKFDELVVNYMTLKTNTILF